MLTRENLLKAIHAELGIVPTETTTNALDRLLINFGEWAKTPMAQAPTIDLGVMTK